jgi:hypothetical protein
VTEHRLKVNSPFHGRSPTALVTLMIDRSWDGDTKVDLLPLGGNSTFVAKVVAICIGFGIVYIITGN